MDFDAVRATVYDVVDAMWDTDPKDRLFSRGSWPAASCEHVAVAVAAVLEDRELGRWNLVQASRPGEINGHAWLEWPGKNDRIEFSVDYTLNQFAEYSQSFIGYGRTPAADEFTVVKYRGFIWDWRWIDTGSITYMQLIDAVRGQLAKY